VTGTVLAVILVALVINLLVMGLILIPPMIGRRSLFDDGPSSDLDAPGLAGIDPGNLIGGIVGESLDEPAAYDRIVRIVSWVFLLSTAVVVGSSGLWPETTPAIFVLLGIAGVFVLVIHDLLPLTALGPARSILEGTVALTFATILVVLTGGYESPFFFTFPLIVGAAALVVRPIATLILSIGAAVGYVVAATLGTGAPTANQLATATADLIALLLLAYIGSVIGREQRRARDAAIRLSAVDSLTGLFNRAFFFAAIDREISRSSRSGRGFCLLMLDLDELKLINDRSGHHAGDAVLRIVAETIRNGVRRIDVAARYGGDEFVALLPETDPTGGWVVAEKIRLTVAGTGVPGLDWRPTVSVGVVSYPRDGQTVDDLMISADQAMYASKRSGRNRVAGPQTIVAESLPGLVAGEVRHSV
jgi:diguanylate cyclase (GGDEF)-like protein